MWRLKTALIAFCAGVFTMLAGTGRGALAPNLEDLTFEDAAEECTTEKDDPREGHEFVGRHMLASYRGCDRRALRDLDRLRVVFDEAVQASGATLLKTAEHVFLPDGLTVVALLSESHASIHTYPEHDACFVDIFTCGRSCSAEKFDAVLREYLRPTKCHHRILLRHSRIVDCL